MFKAVSHIFEGVGTCFFPLGWARPHSPTLDLGSHFALELGDLLGAPKGDQDGAYLASHIEGVQLMLVENTHYMNMTCIFLVHSKFRSITFVATKVHVILQGFFCVNMDA